MMSKNFQNSSIVQCRLYISKKVFLNTEFYNIFRSDKNRIGNAKENVEVKDVLLLNERVYSICDAWPLKRTHRKFIPYMVYLTVHMVIMYMDLFDAFGDLEAMVDNIIDNTVATATYFILFLLRFSKMMEQAIIIVKQEISESKFRNMDEKNLYFGYHKISDKFGRYAVKVTATIAILWYISPMLQMLKLSSGQGNKSESYVLPFRVHIFIDYEDDIRNFIIMYLYQFPLMFIALLHVSSVSLLVSLVLHVCGKFSILSYRIQHMLTKSNIDLDNQIKEFVIAHLKLILTANSINSALEIFLLIELIQTSIRLAVLIYMMLISPEEDVVTSVTYGLYVSIVAAILYLYSYLGECLSYESTRVIEAYYDTKWHDLSVHNQKLFLLVMSSGRQTLHLTAGKIYKFSMYGFIDIVKTCFGYVSLLRALI